MSWREAVVTELSCYTTNLVAYLGGDALSRLAAAVRLDVRVDLPDGLAFRQHARVDEVGLGYRGAPDWAGARDGLTTELAEHGRALAVANTAHLPWSAAHRRHEAPHWVLVTGRDGDRWLVVDHFAALLPDGEQRPFAGWLTETELRAALTPVTDPPPPVRWRDTYALGSEVPVPSGYRWLARGIAPPPAERGEWLTEPEAVLRHLRDRFAADPELLAAHLDDLWAASRHRLLVTPDAQAWAELPRTLRFAVDSARRGRPRASLVTAVFDDLITKTPKEALL